MSSWLWLVLGVLLVTGISAVAGRAHGSGEFDENGKPTGWPSWDRLPSTIWMGLVMAAANYALFEIWWLALLGGVVTALGFSTGHGRVYAMQGANLADPKPEKLERWFGWLWHGPKDVPGYSWFIMGLKGAWVGLPVPPVAILLYAIWPSAYAWSFKHHHDSAPAEWISCGSAGFLASLVIVTKILLLGA